MKKILLLLLLLVNVLSYGQVLNKYKYLVISKRYEFQESTNEYRLNSNARFILAEQGFQVLFEDEPLPDELALDRCKGMYLELVSPDAVMAIKLKIVIRDCNKKILFASPEFASKEKQRSIAFNEALQMSLNSMKALNYHYSGEIAAQPVAVVDSGMVLSAKPIANGFQLLDTQNNTVMTILKTSNKDCFLATKNNVQGVLVSKDYQWFFEYYQNNQFFSEKVKVAF